MKLFTLSLVPPLPRWNAYGNNKGNTSLVPPLPRWNAYSNNKGNTWAEAAIKYMNRHTHTS